MSGIKLTAQKIEKLPYSSKRTLYIDKHPTTKYQSCDFILVVGARTKTAFLRHRPKVNGVRKQQMIKLGDATVISLSELRDMYLEEVIKIRRGESEYLVAKDQREITLGNLVDIYITGKEQGKGKDVSKYDKEQM